MNEPSQLDTEKEIKAAKDIALVVYILQAISILLGFTMIVGVIINYVKRKDVRGTFIESHFRWQIRTFWFGLLWVVVGILTIVFVVGWLILLANGVWFIYRIVKGWLALNDNKPMYSAVETAL